MTTRNNGLLFDEIPGEDDPPGCGADEDEPTWLEETLVAGLATHDDAHHRVAERLVRGDLAGASRAVAMGFGASGGALEAGDAEAEGAGSVAGVEATTAFTRGLDRTLARMLASLTPAERAILERRGVGR